MTGMTGERHNLLDFSPVALQIEFAKLANVLINKLYNVAQLDVCPTGDQEVGESTATGSATFFCGD